MPFPNCRVWTKNLNRLFYPALIPEEELFQLIGMSHQELWNFSSNYTEGFLAEGGPNGVRRYYLGVILELLKCSYMFLRNELNKHNKCFGSERDYLKSSSLS